MRSATERRDRRPTHVALALVLALACAAASPRSHAGPLPPPTLDGAELRRAIRKLSVTGTVLYVAAHPDDENTSMLATLSNGRMVRAIYLSLTRGDGGQNLIGPDTGERLGVIRTQELLAARRVDRAEQWFGRSLDFGFSKKADESIGFWTHYRSLSDVVWAIRLFQPDVVVTRFHPDSTNTHGHHVASARLAREAFTVAADSTRYTEHLHNNVRPWQARRILWNVFRGANAPPDTSPGRVRLELGTYDPLLGRSYTEIAGESRSMHKSQGFGSLERRGRFENTYALLLGEPAKTDLLDGVDLTWRRVPGGAKLIAPLERAASAFDPARPERSLPALLEAWGIMSRLPDVAIVRAKRAELLDVIRNCAGLWVDALASAHTVSPGSPLRVTASALVRNPTAARLLGVVVENNGRALATVDRAIPLETNVTRAETLSVTVPDDARETHPYWLEKHDPRGLPRNFSTGQPEGAPAMVARVRVKILGRPLVFTVPVVHRWVDPVLGERYRDLAVGPGASIRFGEAAYLFPDASPREVALTVQSTDRPVKGALSLRLPQGWSAQPASIPLALRGGEADTTVRFRVTPGPAGSAAVGALFEGDSVRSERGFVRLDYPHIPIQTLWPRAVAKLVRTDLKREGHRVAYLMGSGDQGPDALRQMGYEVTVLEDDDLERRTLSTFDAIVVGVRAYNTRPRLRRLQPRLLDYVAGGGRLVVQYQTPEQGLDDRLGPLPFRLSRDRVTVEEAPVRMVDPRDPLLVTPNRIGPDDFAGWVQERGLSFARPYDKGYRTVLSSNDPGESPNEGGLLVAKHGKGTFVYTGYAFFRQLPAGVPGAWRLFANLVSRENGVTGRVSVGEPAER